jgi:poly(3-hydroxyalkanoate) synthetase
MVEEGAFTVGSDLAATPGAVIARTEMFELIQYTPTTAMVRDAPLLIVPSTINKYYIFDLARGRSVIEHAVGAGHQVFAMSWRNPSPEHARWDLSDYAGSVVRALEIVKEVARTSRTHVAGLCAGGVISAVALAHLAAVGSGDAIASATFVVTVLDHRGLGDVGALIDERSAATAIEESARNGYVDGEALAGVFAWLRPQDRIWRYWINNYLLGRPPSAYDLLYWNADTVNLTAAMHREMLELAIHNPLASPGALVRLGTPLDLGSIKADAYYVAGVTDHLTPWQSALRSAQLLGGDTQFVLVNTGHVTTVVSPPGVEGAAYWSDPVVSEADPGAWLEAAPMRTGSWWEDWIVWLGERGGRRRRARRMLGNERYPPTLPAPGSYVRG